MLLYGCTTCTLSEAVETKLVGDCSVLFWTNLGSIALIITAIQPPNTHQTNLLRRVRHSGYLENKNELLSDYGLLRNDILVLADQQKLHSSALYKHWMPSRRLAVRDRERERERERKRERESQKNPSCRYTLMSLNTLTASLQRGKTPPTSVLWPSWLRL